MSASRRGRGLRLRWPAVVICLSLAACGPSADVSTEPTGTPEAVPSPMSSTSPEPTPTATLETSEPRPTPYLPPASAEPVALPDGLDEYAWATLVAERLDDDGRLTTYHLFAGTLGSGASHVEVIEASTYGITTEVDLGVVAVIQRSRDETVIDLRRIEGWSSVATIEVAALVLNVKLDAARELVYAGVPRGDGGLDITRFGFDGTATTLLYLDQRFATDEPFQRDKATMVVDAEGVLVAEACGESDGCRIWTVPPSASTAGAPTVLASGQLGVCQAIGATPTWLVVADLEVCFIDFMPADIPFRAISRLDGSSHLISNEPLSIRRVLTVGSTTFAVGHRWSEDLSTEDIVTVDVVSGAQETLIEGLQGLVDAGGWLAVDQRSLTGSWVLLSSSTSSDVVPPNAMLINVESGERIELPLGTFGYSA